MHIAAKYTRVAAGSTDSQIESGDNFWFYGIVATTTAGATAGANTRVTVEEADSSTVIFTMQLIANDTESFQIPFIADKGMQITTGSEVDVTVFHANTGR